MLNGSSSHRFGQRMGSHLPFVVVLGAGTVLRLATFLAYQPALEYVQDSFGYLHDAEHLAPNPIRPIGYSLFLRAVDEVTGDFAMVTALQHVFGLLIGILLYVLLRRLGVGRWLAAIASAPVLLDSHQIYIEQFVLSETLFAILITLAAVGVLWPSGKWTARVVVAGVALGVATITRTVGFVVLVGTLTFLVLLVRRCGWRVPLSFALPAVLIVVGYGLWFFSEHGRFGLEGYRGYTLAARVQPFADCRGLRLPPDEAIFCDPRPRQYRPPPDTYLWAEDAPLRRRDGVPGPERDRSAARFAVRIIRHQPLDYLRTVLGNFFHYFAPGERVGPQDNAVETLRFRTSYTPGPWHPVYPPQDPYNTNWTWPEGVRYQVILGRYGFDLGEHEAKLNAPLARGLRAYGRFGTTPGPFLALSVVVAVVSGVGRVKETHWRQRAAAVFFVAMGLMSLLMPAAVGSFDYRYRLPALILLPPAGALGVHLALLRSGRRKPVRSYARPGDISASDRLDRRRSLEPASTLGPTPA